MVTFRGGTHIGWVNASWPFASLSAGPDLLTLKVLLLGTYTFRPEEVVSIERKTILPILGWGVRINHVKPDCAEKVIFWCLGSPDAVLRGIQGAGFQPKSTQPLQSLSRTVPLRWPSVGVVIVLWNALIGFDLWQTRQPGLGALAALFVLFFVSTGVWWLPPVRWAVMKPGRNPSELRPLFNRLAVISGFVLVAFSIPGVTGSFKSR